MKKVLFSLGVCLFTVATLSGCVGVGLVDCTYVDEPNTGRMRQVCIPSKSTLTRISPESIENVEKLRLKYKNTLMPADEYRRRSSGILSSVVYGEPTTTAMYTPPLLIKPSEHIYDFTIAVGGALDSSAADQRAEAEIRKFMDQKGFGRYKILSRKKGLLISRFVYTVQFYR